MDRMQEELGPLKAFILPGGNMSGAVAHVARTVCRRAERHVVNLSREMASEKGEGKLDGVIVYLNRLSDLLFTFARLANMRAGISDREW